MGFPYLPILPPCGITQLMPTHLTGIEWYLFVVSHFFSLITKIIDHFFKCLLVFGDSSSATACYILCPFLCWGWFLFLFGYRNYLYILEIESFVGFSHCKHLLIYYLVTLSTSPWLNRNLHLAVFKSNFGGEGDLYITLWVKAWTTARHP